MATTSINALGDTGAVDGALANYLRRRAEPNLFLNYELVPIASEAEVPTNEGVHMNIPTFVNDSTHGVKTLDAATDEAFPLGTDSGAGSLRTSEVDTSTERKMSLFADGFKVSKAYKSTASVQGEFERIAQFIMKTAAQTQEKLVQNNIIYESGAALTAPNGAGTIWNGLSAQGYTTGEPIYVAPDATGTAWGSLTSSDVAVANQFALARKYLKARGNPGFSMLGGKLAAIVGPDTIYRLTTQVTTTTGQAALTFENESMNRVRTFNEAVAGDLLGFRLIETNFPITVAGGVTNGPSASVDCEINVLCAPDAFYITPHQRLTPQLYVTPFDAGGWTNPTRSISVLATDFMFGAIRGPEFENKLALMPCAIA
jgi:hypothetical protein